MAKFYRFLINILQKYCECAQKPPQRLALCFPIKVVAEDLEGLVKQVDSTGLPRSSISPLQHLAKTALPGSRVCSPDLTLTSHTPCTHLPCIFYATKLTKFHPEIVAINFFKEYFKADSFLTIVPKSWRSGR